jgi:hypothetical protein
MLTANAQRVSLPSLPVRKRSLPLHSRSGYEIRSTRQGRAVDLMIDVNEQERRMSAPQASASPRRSSATLAAFLLGLPLAAGVLFALFRFVPGDSVVLRYVSHPVEWVEVVMFCCALGALAGKIMGQLGEWLGQRSEFLPPWDGNPVAATEAAGLLSRLQRLPRRLLRTRLGQRMLAVLDFTKQRRSANELDDELRSLADADAMALEASYGLTRFITWAIPILGFLGTVVGITKAIAGVTPEVLEHDLNRVTDGLAEAFDTTALALGLTMLTMLCTFLIERLEQGSLEAVDHRVEQELGHRFVRTAATAASGSETGQALVEATEALVEKQVELWANSLAEVDKRAAQAWTGQQEKLTAGLQQALQGSLEKHAERMAALENKTVEQGTALFKQMKDLGEAVARVADGLVAQARTLAQLQQGEKQLAQLQMLLQQNLATLAGTGTFEKAVLSLTAAIHLLTARTGPEPGPLAAFRPVPEPARPSPSGKAA